MADPKDAKHLEIPTNAFDDPDKFKQFLEQIRDFKQGQDQDEISRKERIKEAQQAYLERFRILTIPSGVAYKIGNWIGIPLMATAIFIDWTTISAIGLFLFLLGLTLQLALVVAVVPGLIRITREASEEADG